MNYPFTVTKKDETYTVQFGQEYWEKFAAAMGLLSDECLASIQMAEEDFKKGRVLTIKSFRELED